MGLFGGLDNRFFRFLYLYNRLFRFFLYNRDFTLFSLYYRLYDLSLRHGVFRFLYRTHLSLSFVILNSLSQLFDRSNRFLDLLGQLFNLRHTTDFLGFQQYNTLSNCFELTSSRLGTDFTCFHFFDILWASFGIFLLLLDTWGKRLLNLL